MTTRILRGQGLLDEGRTLRTRNRNLESLKVGEVGARILARNLLAPRACRPFARNVRALHRRFERGAIASALDVDLQVGNRHTAETDHITLHARGVNEHPVLVNDINNHQKLAVALIRLQVAQRNAADFDISLRARHTSIDISGSVSTR